MLCNIAHTKNIIKNKYLIYIEYIIKKNIDELY
jgi:hypothetical protein